MTAPLLAYGYHYWFLTQGPNVSDFNNFPKGKIIEFTTNEGGIMRFELISKSDPSCLDYISFKAKIMIEGKDVLVRVNYYFDTPMLYVSINQPIKDPTWVTKNITAPESLQLTTPASPAKGMVVDEVSRDVGRDSTATIPKLIDVVDDGVPITLVRPDVVEEKYSHNIRQNLPRRKFMAASTTGIAIAIALGIISFLLIAYNIWQYYQIIAK